MQTRTLRVWDGEDTGDRLNVAGQHRAEYEGPYLERYEPPTAAMKANMPEWKWQRIGLILDRVKARAAVFRQAVASREDATPTDLVIGPGHERAGAYVLAAWSTDPQHADPWGPDAPCAVWDFTEREPTEDEKRTLAAIRRGPPRPPSVTPSPCGTEQDADRLRALAAGTLEDAMNAVVAHFPDLTTPELHAGMMHARGLPWCRIEEQCGARSTVSKYITRFYEVTRWPRADRRKGMGKKLHLDEARDGEDPQEDTFAEHCEHPRTPAPAKGERDRPTR